MDEDVQLPFLTLLRLRLFTVWFDPLVIFLIRVYAHAVNHYYYTVMRFNIWLFRHLKADVFAKYVSKYQITNVAAAFVAPPENDGGVGGEADGGVGGEVGGEADGDFIHLDLLTRAYNGKLDISQKKLTFLLENLLHSDCTLGGDKCISMADISKFTGANIIEMAVAQEDAAYERVIVRPSEEVPTYMYTTKRGSGEQRVRSACETSHFQPFA